MKPSPIPLLVISALAGTLLLIAITFAACAVLSIPIASETSTVLKEVALIALGSLSSVLARTGHDAPSKTEIINTPDKPVPTDAV